jgi:hypothetical protein
MPEEVETPPQMLIQVGFAPDEVKALKIKRGAGRASAATTPVTRAASDSSRFSCSPMRSGT